MVTIVVIVFYLMGAVASYFAYEAYMSWKWINDWPELTWQEAYSLGDYIINIIFSLFCWPIFIPVIFLFWAVEKL